MTADAVTQMNVPASTIYRRLLSYSARQWPLMALAIGSMIVTAAAETGFAALMKPLLDGSFVARDPHAIRWLPIWLVIIFTVAGVASFITGYAMTRVGRAVVQTLRARMFGQFLAIPATFFDNANSGGLISKIAYDVEQVAEAATTSVTILIRDTLTVIGLLGWMFYLNWQMTLGLLIVAPIIMLIVRVVTRGYRRYSASIQRSMGDFTHLTQEVIEGHRVVKVFGGQHYERAQFDTVNARNSKLHLKMAILRSASTPIVQLLVAVALAGMIFYATQESLQDVITVGAFMSFMTAMMMLLTPIKRLTDVNATIQRGLAAGASVFQILDEPVEIDAGTRQLGRARGRIEFRHVHFRYAINKPYVIDDLSLLIEPGETVALVGRSGGGKTTLVNLVPRLYDVTAGQVRIDDIPVHELALQNLRDQIAYVGQHVTLFNDTIRNNIAYGRLNESSEAQIIDAARAAHAWEFIQALPQGLDTPVGERGLLLSGGQRQRLAIARALLKDAPILILDEATASLDTESERLIQDALQRLAQGRTTLIIAHRLSTIERADRILVVNEGRIIESGTHQALLERDGAYARLYRLQFRDGDAGVSTPALSVDLDEPDAAAVTEAPRSHGVD
ncbi:MAG: lipid A export permease/ATP-binding protein MsbA [Thiotrichales bacterium]